MLGFICQILHNIFHNVKIASSGEMNISDFTVWFPLKDKAMFDFLGDTIPS